MKTCLHQGNCDCARPDECEWCHGTERLVKIDSRYLVGVGQISYVSTDYCEEVECYKCKEPEPDPDRKYDEGRENEGFEPF